MKTIAKLNQQDRNEQSPITPWQELENIKFEVGHLRIVNVQLLDALEQAKGMAEQILNCLRVYNDLPDSIHPHEVFDMTSARGWALAIIDRSNPAIAQAKGQGKV